MNTEQLKILMQIGAIRDFAAAHHHQPVRPEPVLYSRKFS